MHNRVSAEPSSQTLDHDVVLSVDALTTQIATSRGRFDAVSQSSFTLRRGEALAMVGESGSGKSITCHSIIGLIEAPAAVSGGRALFRRRNGKVVDLLAQDDRGLRDLRGAEIAMVAQDPTGSLNPVLTIGAQLREIAARHLKLSRRDADTLSLELLTKVGIADPALRLRQYPHQLSGGMRQRVMIAMALVCRPSLLIADEATTALDVTIQAQILELFRDLKAGADQTAFLLVTHNMGVVAEIADRVLVMYAGRIVEAGDVDAVLRAPRHPYTRALLRCIPSGDGTASHGRIASIPGSAPDPQSRPPGCAFAPRCASAIAACTEADPDLEDTGSGRLVRCFRWRELAA